MQLDNFNEIVGKLHHIESTDDDLILVFEILKKVRISKDKINADDIKNQVGQKISIINIDGDFSMRVIN